MKHVEQTIKLPTEPETDLEQIKSTQENIADQMRQVCSSLDTDFIKEAKRHGIKSGSTLLFSVINNGHLSIANVGDSCGFLMKNNGCMTKVTVD